MSHDYNNIPKAGVDTGRNHRHSHDTPYREPVNIPNNVRRSSLTPIGWYFVIVCLIVVGGIIALTTT